MTKSFSVTLCSFAFLLVHVPTFGFSSSIQVLKNLTVGYDKKARPFLNVAPTNVSVQIAMIALGPISEKEQSMKSDIFLRQWWKDPRLNAGQDQFTFNIDPSTYFWVPDTFVSNSRKTESHQTLTKNSLVRLGPEGSVYASMRFTILCHCKMDLRRFPHDEQECAIDLETYAFSGNEVSLYWKSITEPVKALDLSTAGYQVLSIRGIRDVTYYLNLPFPKLRAILKLKRSFPYFLYHVYIPGMLLVILSFTTFFIPPTAVPARVTLIVTNFLSTMFIFGSSSDLIPKEPYITAMEIYSLINIFFIILVMVEYILVLKMKFLISKRYSKPSAIFGKTGNLEMTERTINGDREENGNSPAKKEPHTNKNLHFLDSFAIFFFPITYLICLVTYFIVYS